MADVFLSYAPGDHVFARDVSRALHRANLDVFHHRGEGEALGDEPWRNMVAEQVAGAPIFVLLISEASAASEAVLDEATIARNRGKSIYLARLAPSVEPPKAVTDPEIAGEAGQPAFAPPSKIVELWRKDPTAVAPAPTNELISKPILIDDLAPPKDDEEAEAAKDPKSKKAKDAAKDKAAEPADVEIYEPVPARVAELVADILADPKLANRRRDLRRTEYGEVSTQSMVYWRWKAVEASEDLAQYDAFIEEFAGEPGYARLAADRRVQLERTIAERARADRNRRRAAAWKSGFDGFVNFGLRIATAAAVVGLAVLLLSQTRGGAQAGGGTGLSLSQQASAGRTSSAADAQIRQLAQQVSALRRARDAALSDRDRLARALAAAQQAEDSAKSRANTLEEQLNLLRANGSGGATPQPVPPAAQSPDARELQRMEAALAEVVRERNGLREMLLEAEKKLRAAGSAGQQVATPQVPREVRVQMASLEQERDQLRTQLSELTTAGRRAAEINQDLQRQVGDLRQQLGQRPAASGSDRVRVADFDPNSLGIRSIVRALRIPESALRAQDNVQRTDEAGTATLLPVKRSDEPAVSRMQQCLRRLDGVDGLRIDGRWGADTMDGFIRFIRAGAPFDLFNCG